MHSWNKDTRHDYALHWSSNHTDFDVAIFQSNRTHRGKDKDLHICSNVLKQIIPYYNTADFYENSCFCELKK